MKCAGPASGAALSAAAFVAAVVGGCAIGAGAYMIWDGADIGGGLAILQAFCVGPGGALQLLGARGLVLRLRAVDGSDPTLARVSVGFSAWTSVAGGLLASVPVLLSAYSDLVEQPTGGVFTTMPALGTLGLLPAASSLALIAAFTAARPSPARA